MLNNLTLKSHSKSQKTNYWIFCFFFLNQFSEANLTENLSFNRNLKQNRFLSSVLLLPGSEIFSAGFRFVGDPDSNSKELLLGWVWRALRSPNGHFASDLKQPSVDCEVEVSDLGVVRSIISGFAWNWKKSVLKVKSKKLSELKGSGIAMEEPELEAWEPTETDRDWDTKLTTGEASPSK
jgi:hypothetical protein